MTPFAVSVPRYAEPLVTERAEGLLGEAATAVFSGDYAYRYLLTRTWDDQPPMVLVMLNPSTASAMEDDATIRRCIRFARREKCGGIRVANLFALRSTDPRGLRTHPDPVGPRNDEFILEHCLPGRLVVAAWGAHGSLRDRDREVCSHLVTVPVPLLRLGVTKGGHPKHPLARGRERVPDDAPLLPWEPAP